MKLECPRTNTHPTGKAPRWTATGLFNTNRRGLRRAGLRCEVCGFYWSSALPEAITAGEIAAADPELQVGTQTLPEGVRVPQPSLPMPGARGADFVKPGALARSSRFAHFLDTKQRQTGSD